MTTNGDWLFSKPIEEQLEWLNAERVEPDGLTAVYRARLCEVESEREMYRETTAALMGFITDALNEVSRIIDKYDEGLA